jgi:hypothetical protein
MAAIILRHFNYNFILNNSLLLILGMVKSGKSILTKDILYNFNDIPIGSIISEPNNQTLNYIPPIFVYDKYDKHIIKKFIKRQDILVENNEYDSRAFIVFSNCFLHKNIKKDKYFNQIISSNKVYNYLCIYETDFYNNIYKEFIDNIDFVFIMKEDLDINRRNIYKLFEKKLGIQYSLFNKLMDDYTSNYNLLVLDLKCESNRLEDKLFWYSSSLHDNFKICNEESWIYSKNNYIKEPPKRILNRNIFY